MCLPDQQEMLALLESRAAARPQPRPEVRFGKIQRVPNDPIDPEVINAIFQRVKLKHNPQIKSDQFRRDM